MPESLPSGYDIVMAEDPVTWVTRSLTPDEDDQRAVREGSRKRVSCAAADMRLI